jgi:alanine racemase
LKNSIKHIAFIIQAETKIRYESEIEYLFIDSRKTVFPASSLFFAIAGPRRNGHEFIKELYERGVKNFVVQNTYDGPFFPDANFLLVKDVLHGMQVLVAHHRQQFTFPVIGITGSNGKTIVKEWLYQLLQEDYNIVRSPRSYNSQIGVPLSVWQINSKHTLGIFEAGISKVNEMQLLERIIRPTIGVLTNIGEAHNEGFENEEEKVNEKLKLFKDCKQLVYCMDLQLSGKVPSQVQLFSWSRNSSNATVYIKDEIKKGSQTELEIVYQNESFLVVIPFVDAASVENGITCFCLLLLLGYDMSKISKRLKQIHPVQMRLQLIKAVNNCSVLNDSYSNDISSLSIALDYLKQQAGNNKTTVIISDILQSGLADEKLYQKVAQELIQRNISRLIGIGENINKHRNFFLNAFAETVFYPSIEIFLEQFTSNQFRDEFILLKGARVFAFERISKWLEQKVHQTVLEINLSALAHNLKEYQKHLLPSTKLMAMVKAFSYGSGSAEIARVLQFCKVDYLAVAYADEGVELRKAGISLPIMVMNADQASFDVLIEYNLEPEIYSFNMYHSLLQYFLNQGIRMFPVHIKVNTGMNRLGFEPDEINELGLSLKKNNTMAIISVFSHLVGSESKVENDFTKHQSLLFDEACLQIEKIIGYQFIRHIANSAAIYRHKLLQYNMVRLGIGLYGIDSGDEKEVTLETVMTLKSTIAQIRKVKSGKTIGYNRRGKVYRDSNIATIRIGYADGLSRRLGNNVGSVYLNGQLAPIIGSVCMDMAMIDITDIENVKEGDEVEIFGKYLPVQKIAEWCGTITYEILTTISQRVKRVYIEE